MPYDLKVSALRPAVHLTEVSLPSEACRPRVRERFIRRRSTSQTKTGAHGAFPHPAPLSNPSVSVRFSPDMRVIPPAAGFTGKHLTALRAPFPAYGVLKMISSRRRYSVAPRVLWQNASTNQSISFSASYCTSAYRSPFFFWPFMLESVHRTVFVSGS